MRVALFTLLFLIACGDDGETLSPDAGIDAAPCIDAPWTPTPECKREETADSYCEERWPTTFAIMCGYNTHPDNFDCVKQTDVPWHCCCPVQGGCFQ